MRKIITTVFIIILFILVVVGKANAWSNPFSSINFRSLLASVEGTGSGLQLWYTFDEGSGSTAQDSSGNGSTASFSNSPTWTTGKLGGALHFSGGNTGTRVNAPVGFSSTFSVCAWIKPTIAASGVSSLEIAMSSPFEFTIFGVDGNAGLQIYNNGSGFVSGGSVVSGTWKHACTTVGSGVGKLYLDGVEVGSGGFTVGSGQAAMIGDRGNYQTFNGDIDDFRLYDRVLSSSEIMEIYNQASTGGPTTQYTLTVTNNGNGSIASNPSGISCGGTCSAQYTVGTPVTLTASPNSGYLVTWSGCGSTTTGNTCSIGMSGNKTINATFSLIPPAPVISSVTTSNVTSSRATIAWTTDTAGDTQVEYGTSEALGTKTTKNTTLSTSHTQTLSGLTANTTYSFRALSSNAYGVEGASSISTFTTSPSGASKPTYISAKGVAPNQINVLWLRSIPEDGSSVSSYSVYRNGALIATLPESQYIDPYHDTEQQIYEDFSVSPGATYSYYVVAKDNSNRTSPPSDTVSGTALSGTPSVLPTNRTASWTPGVNVGVPGGIPERTHQIDVTQAPYFADNTGVKDSTAAINQAITDAAANDVVYLPEGTYKLTGNGIYVFQKGQFTVRGAGMDKTILKCSGGCITLRGAEFYNISTVVNVVSGFTKGSTQITLSDASAFPPNTLMSISAENDLSIPVMAPGGMATMMRNQKFIVKARNGNTVTVAPPVISDLGGLSAYASPANFVPIMYAGIEDLTADMSAGYAQVGIAMYGNYGSWIKNVKVKGVKNYTISLAEDVNCEIRGSFLGALDHSENQSNGAGLLTGGITGCLVEDNIIEKSFPLMEINGSSIGNVFGYNFVMEQSTNTNHGPHNSFNLYEGNLLKSSEFKSDGYFGGESDATFYRNWLGDGFMAFKRFSRNFSVIGNVIGTYSLGQPNIGNGASDGYAQMSKGIYWKDWNPTVGPTIRGTLTKVSDTNATVHLNSHDDAVRLLGYIRSLCNGLDIVSNPTARGCNHPTSVDWGLGVNRSKVRGMSIASLDTTTDTVTLSGGYPTPSLPASGTTVGLWPRSEGFQELDLDVALTLIRKNNKTTSSTGIALYERNTTLGNDALPNSLYLTSKPAWFGDLEWPPFGPTKNISFNQNAIPASYRYYHSQTAPSNSGSNTSSNTGSNTTSSNSSGNTTSTSGTANSTGTSGAHTGIGPSTNAPSGTIAPGCVVTYASSTLPVLPAFTPPLVVGSRGANVITLQTFLANRSYLARTYVTGYYGEITKAAVLRYITARNSKVPVQTCSTATTTAPILYTNGSFKFTRTLALGSVGTDVKMLQIYLNNKGFRVATAGIGSPGKETTYFGPATKAALIKFQIANRIAPASGLFGPITRAKIESLK